VLYFRQKSDDNQMPILKQDLLNRLIWSVFDSIDDIRVLDDPNDLSSESRPFSGHPIALEHVTNYALRTMLVTEGVLGLKEESFSELLDEWNAPVLTVARDDNEPITIGDFVMQVHTWLQSQKQEILEFEEEMTGKIHAEFKYMYCGWVWVPSLEDLELDFENQSFQLHLQPRGLTGERQV